MAAGDDANETVGEGVDAAPDEAFNPWSVVHLVFDHLSGQGLHPTLGHGGDPGAPAAELLRRLGIEPRAEGDRRVERDVQAHLAEIRAAMLEDP